MASTFPELQDLQQRIRAVSNNPNVSEEARASALQAEATALVAQYLADISAVFAQSFDAGSHAIQIKTRD